VPLWNSASALPSEARSSAGQASAASPSVASFFCNAGVGAPAASKATLTGSSFWRNGLSGARASTWVMDTASRRGDA